MKILWKIPLLLISIQNHPMKISINKPCHENWDGMLPDQKGAFCLSCQKSVVDFSNKTLGQIKDFFNQKKDNVSVCGRFDEAQLKALSFDDFFSDFVNWKLTRKVALIVFFVFGLSLFGNAQTKSKPRPKPAVHQPVVTKPVVHDPMIMGDIAWIPEDKTKKVCPKDTLEETPKVMGKIRYSPEKESR